MKLYTLLFILLTSTCVFSQNTENEKRIEFELKDGFSGERIYEFNTEGFLVFSRQTKDEGTNALYKFEKFNTDLISTGEVTYTIENNFAFDEIYQDGQNLFIFFKTKRGDFKVTKFNFTKLDFQDFTGELPKRSYSKFTACMGDKAYIGLISKSMNISIISIDMVNGTQSTTPITIEGFKPSKLSLTNLQTLPESKDIFISINAMISKKRSEMFVLRMDNEGVIKESVNVSAGTEKNIRNANAYEFSKGQFMLTGTYAVEKMAGSTGFYISRIDNGVLQPINYYNYTELTNFLSYLPENRVRKIEKKKKRKNDKGEELNISYNMVAHQPIKVGEDFIFIGEAYYPTYRTESRTTTSFVNGKAVTTTTYYQVFDGYQYTHAFVAKFDKEGKLLWDQTFSMFLSSKPMYVKKFIHVAEQNQDNVKLVYANGWRIHNKVFDFNGTVVSEKQSDEIETGSEGDKTRLSSSNIQYWYDQYFLAYGIQRIVNKEDKSVDRKRTVFYVNKIKVN